MHLRRERLERRWHEQAAVEGAVSLMGEPSPQPDEWTWSAELTTAIQYAIQQLPPTLSGGLPPPPRRAAQLRGDCSAHGHFAQDRRGTDRRSAQGFA
jgi:hypothetical protein